jgi:SAM-dependent methyltransferase
MNAESHYDEHYFVSRERDFQFGGWANLPKFAGFIRDTHTVLDFGCSGGYLLEHIRCARKIGVELNSVPRAIAGQKGIEVHERLTTVAPESVDVAISNHVLEHTINPLAELRAIRQKLKPGGKLVIVVPSEGPRVRYKPGDSDFHLFTWSPMNLGNLLTAAGYKVIESKAYRHKWPPRIHRLLAKLGGRLGFDLACRLYAYIAPGMLQVRAIAQK